MENQNRSIFSLMKKEEQFLLDKETLIFISDGELSALHNDGERLLLTQFSNDSEIQEFLDSKLGFKHEL